MGVADRARVALAVCAAAFTMAWAAPAAAQPHVLRVVPHANLAILDPVWTTAYMSRNHGYMIYDTLFGTDAQGRVQPQMVATWSVSPDGLEWRFSLREGLRFHDGAPVTGEDVVASLRRWGQRDAMGSALMKFVAAMEATGADSFRLRLREPCGFVLEALGKPSSNVPFIMPRRVAATDAYTQIREHVGSGPFMFVPSEFRPGERAVYLRNPAYRPRAEPPSGTAGGKRALVERVEWNLALRDPQAQVHALTRGEVDILEQLSYDHYDQVRRDANLQVPEIANVGIQFFARFNHLHKPFDHPKARQAAIAALAQEPHLRAQVGVPAIYRTCAALFMCETPLATPDPAARLATPDLATARRLLAEAGYDGTPVVLLKPTDLRVIDRMPDVAAQLLRQAGFVVQMHAMDWQTLVARRARKSAPAEGGWNLLITAAQAHDVWTPISNPAMDARGEASVMYGWARDDELVRLRERFMRARTDAEKQQLAAALQRRAYEVGTHVPLGEAALPMAAGRRVSGFFVSNAHVYWNLRKD